MKECKYAKANGTLCGSPACKNSDYCYFHTAARERSKRRHRNARLHLPLQLPPLEDMQSIQVAIGDVLNALLADQIDTKKAGLLLYGLQTAAVNARHADFGILDSEANLNEYEPDEDLEEEEPEEPSPDQEPREQLPVVTAKAIDPTPLPERKPPQPAQADHSIETRAERQKKKG
jgi:hypothetical protein